MASRVSQEVSAIVKALGKARRPNQYVDAVYDITQKFYSQAESKQLLAYLVITRFGVSDESDIVLNSWGLLDGIDPAKGVTERRKDFAQQSERSHYLNHKEDALYLQIAERIHSYGDKKQTLFDAALKKENRIQIPCIPSYRTKQETPTIAIAQTGTTLFADNDNNPLALQTLEPVLDETVDVIKQSENIETEGCVQESECTENQDQNVEENELPQEPESLSSPNVDVATPNPALQSKKRKKESKYERIRRKRANPPVPASRKKIRLLQITLVVILVLGVSLGIILRDEPGNEDIPSNNGLPVSSVPDEDFDIAAPFDEIVSGDDEILAKPSWGDNSGDDQGYSQRHTYTTSEIESGALGGNAAVFNSIVDETVDERNFVSVCESSALDGGRNADWQNVSIEVKDGEIYTIRLYVHNDNLNGFRSVAENTRVKYVVPTEISNEQEIRGYITSSNASPSEYWSSVLFESQTNVFSLEYIEDSFKICNEATGSRGYQLGTFQSDNYTMIGYKYMDGEYPGGSQYASYIYIQVRVVFEAQCEIKTTQRILNSPDKSWYKTMEAEIGDLIECQFYYRNTGDVMQENLTIRYVLPNNLEYVTDSTVLYNSNYQSGVTLKDNTIATTGINIGHYQPQGNAYIRFTVRAVDNSLSVGSNCLMNWGAVTVTGKVAKDSTAIFVVK